jgi:hypothetical protein
MIKDLVGALTEFATTPEKTSRVIAFGLLITSGIALWQVPGTTGGLQTALALYGMIMPSLVFYADIGRAKAQPLKESRAVRDIEQLKLQDVAGAAHIPIATQLLKSKPKAPRPRRKDLSL